MKLGFLRPTLIAAVGIGIAGTASAEWTKTYVIDWYEPAMYFGGKDILAPGTDCPNGTNPEIDWVKVLIKAGYSEAEAKWLRNPENPSRSPVHGQNQMAFRGKNRENVYIHPETYPDPGLVGVTGDITEGFNLDDNEKSGYSSPNGEKGIDNNFYRALGCTKSYRGPPRLSSGALGTNDTMRNGGWTVAIVVHGAGKDPMNDSNVDVGFYMSGDKLVKDGNGDIARDYTFRIKPSKLEGIFKAKTSNGVITSKGAAPEIWTRDPGGARDLQLLRARLKLTMKPDGTLEGLVGGYRPWLPVYTALVNARGPVVEVLGWIEIPAIYYALKRNADYSPAGPKGEKTHISYAMRVNAIPAYVITPDATAQLASVVSYKAGALEEPPPKPLFGAIDGMVPDRNVPFGKALEVYPVPGSIAANSPTSGSRN
ncbi:MAG TPA: hypothetical protein VET48_14625 [Steroidobacteraceae bacterium]|nr:hypothetical protein [Steroidobacteraceae bacterium]